MKNIRWYLLLSLAALSLAVGCLSTGHQPPVESADPPSQETVPISQLPENPVLTMEVEQLPSDQYCAVFGVLFRDSEGRVVLFQGDDTVGEVDAQGGDNGISVSYPLALSDTGYPGNEALMVCLWDDDGQAEGKSGRIKVVDVVPENGPVIAGLWEADVVAKDCQPHVEFRIANRQGEETYPLTRVAASFQTVIVESRWTDTQNPFEVTGQLSDSRILLRDGSELEFQSGSSWRSDQATGGVEEELTYRWYFSTAHGSYFDPGDIAAVEFSSCRYDLEPME